jgi:D-lactate dehydrogenase (cytochrome)
LPSGETLSIEPRERALRYPLAPYDGMDLLDLFIGSEGMLGVITGIELKLAERPIHNWGVMGFFTDVEAAYRFVDDMRSYDRIRPGVIGVFEFFDGSALRYAERMRTRTSKSGKMPRVPDHAEAALYIEFVADDEGIIEDAAMSMLDALDKNGVPEELTSAGVNRSETERFRDFRHAVPEAINEEIGLRRQLYKEIHKCACDFSVPGGDFREIAELYRRDIAASGLSGAVFGHVTDIHLHVNLIPRDSGEMKRAEDMIEGWAERIGDAGGAIITENGVGKLKKTLYTSRIPRSAIDTALRIKHFFDPDGLLNPGNMFDEAPPTRI